MLSSLRPGDIIQQKYRLERVVGQGGMAIVVAAFHLHLEQRVAIKLLRPETVSHPEVIPRFLREARAASKIESSAVARVIDVDALPDGTPFIVMEYLEGRDLSWVAREGQRLPPHEAASYVQQACAALTEAHGLGIIHRDIKPANLFLTKKRSGEPQIKVLDFGISKLLEDTDITKSETAMGSAEYMSPEQMTSARDVDARTDIWSLGVTLYELSTACSPFRAEGIGAVCVAVMSAKPRPPRAIVPDLPAGLEDVILRCLDKDPARRFATAAELADALAPFTVAPPPPPPPRPDSSAASAPSPWTRPLPKAAAPTPSAAPKPAAPVKRPPWPLLGAAFAGAVVVTGVILFVVMRGRGKGSVAASGDRYKLNADTLYDSKTKLTWQRKPSPGALDWAAAKAYCDRAGGGYRLPQVQELTGLLEWTTLEPPLDPVSFPTSPVDAFWSASPASGVGNAWVVHFYNGRVAPTAASFQNRVRCVR